ncbi:inhibitor of apoptosis-promoting Bax1-domain-containing protein [Aspergillus avenaceus]|uniref:Inhibitor of apoptosis-promoting Bax1-domain-containing protein n=1 Tax=Aspergillus avenaceus TaxID=36643 RepID=A0A5N6TJC6_ASPAV|nr:inhibitor of apoptosis-promoting Bax1-domain-containing protein [Aspergillus avenaceus]
MAFFLRRPFAVPTALRQVPKTANTARFIHNTPFKAPLPKPAGPVTSSIFAKSRQTFQNAFRRTYMQQSYAPQSGNLTQRLLYGAAIVGGTILATNLIFNRETREDGGMPPYERSYLNDTFLHTGLGIGIIGIAARALHMNGWSYRLMAMNPWLVAGLGLVGSIGTMYGTFYTSPDNYLAKYGLWTAFNVTQAALLSPLMFMHPALLARAGLYTVGMMGSIAFVGATAKQDKYLYLGAPLLAGVTIVALSGLAPLVLPVTATRTLMWSEKIWLYGGLAVFGGFTLYDVQKVLHHARLAERGYVRRDVVNESISLELDFINIFVRMVQILAMQRQNRK